MKRLILACCMFGISTVSFAGHCPVDAKAIDEGLAKASLSDEIKAEIASLAIRVCQSTKRVITAQQKSPSLKRCECY